MARKGSESKHYGKRETGKAFEEGSGEDGGLEIEVVEGCCRAQAPDGARARRLATPGSRAAAEARVTRVAAVGSMAGRVCCGSRLLLRPHCCRCRLSML